MVVSELRGEKIDIIPYNDEPARFVAKALSPARVREVLVDDDNRQATVVVPDDQLSLAIGREGQNARLAARLTGWRIDIRSETEFSEEEAQQGYDEEESSGRCAAILANGRRCPNASLPGSRYCGLDSHQALSNIDTDRVEDLARIGEQPPPEQEEALEEIADELAQESPDVVAEGPEAEEGSEPGEEEAELDDEAVGAEHETETVQQPAEAAPGEAAEEPSS
jgi:N utilization substance protein A